MSGYGDKPYGMNEIVIVDGDDNVYPFPVAQALEFEERVVSGELPGDDSLQAVAAHSNGVKWKLKQGGISLEAYAAMTGRTATESGSTPNRTNTLAGGNTGLAFPYFDIYGKALGDEGDDIYYHLVNAKITEGISGNLTNQAFLINEIGGIALDWEIVQRETADDLPVGS